MNRRHRLAPAMMIGLIALGCTGQTAKTGQPCTRDSQCVAGDYCDLTATPCDDDGGLATIAGTCHAACSGICPCATDDDCLTHEVCQAATIAGQYECYLDNPCPGQGVCNPDTRTCPQVPAPACAPPCSLTFEPHNPCQAFCVCPSNTCTAR
jgi:hypothetical protein